MGQKNEHICVKKNLISLEGGVQFFFALLVSFWVVETNRLSSVEANADCLSIYQGIEEIENGGNTITA